MKVGPKPSRASVDAGAVTQFWVKKLSPTSKVRRSSLVKLRAEKLKALRLLTNAVVSPPSSSCINDWLSCLILYQRQDG